MRAFKRVYFVIVTPDGRKTKQAVAPPRKKFNSTGIDALLEQCAGQIEQSFPGVEFRLVPVGPNRFNFIHQACDSPNEASA
jgi:hypothetical protein